MGFVQTDGIKGFGRPKEGQAHAPDANISGTSRRVLATAMGHDQRPLEHENRVKKGACIDEKLMKNEMTEWENAAEFWISARMGTLLPEASTSTNDMFKVKYQFVPQTGIWWDNTMQNAGLCDGVLEHFLLLSDLDLQISHFEFFTALMRPYLTHKGIQDRVYGGPLAAGIHKNAWGVPVLSKLNIFEFTSNPYVDISLRGLREHLHAPGCALCTTC
jgi:hypothetical protein